MIEESRDLDLRTKHAAFGCSQMWCRFSLRCCEISSKKTKSSSTCVHVGPHGRHGEAYSKNKAAKNETCELLCAWLRSRPNRVQQTEQRLVSAAPSGPNQLASLTECDRPPSLEF